MKVCFFDEDSDDETQDCNDRDCGDLMSNSAALPQRSTPLDDPTTQDGASASPPPQPRRSGRVKEVVKYTAASNGDCIAGSASFMTCDLGDMFDCILPQCNLVTTNADVPRSFGKAISGPKGEDWIKACQKEIHAMKDKKVWVLVNRPKSSNVIQGLWLFRKKHTSDPANPMKFKSRFVAMGNTQVKGED